MGKFSNKSKAKPSKRKTLKQKYKIERKVKEFKKKTRRTARKLRAGGGKRGGKKQQTLPNLFPFKADVIEQARAEREYMKKLRHKKEGMAIEQPTEVICKKNRKSFSASGKLVEICDVIIEVLDARDPQGCRVSQLQRETITQHGKKLILLLNKVDLVGVEVANQWYKVLNAVHPTVMYRSVKTLDVGQQTPVDSVGAIGHGYLFHLIKTLLPDKQVTVGVLGLPGVGKTSFMQSLISLAKPPHVNSKDATFFQVDKNISILDTVEIVDSHPLPLVLQGQNPCKELINEILQAVPAGVLTELYKIQDYENVDDFLVRVAKATGQLQKGGVPDLHRTVKLVCEDWKRQRIQYRVEAK